VANGPVPDSQERSHSVAAYRFFRRPALGWIGNARMQFSNAWARATMLAPLSNTGVDALNRLAVLLERLSVRVPTLPWLVLGLSAAFGLVSAGLLLYAVAVLAVGVVVFVLAEAAVLLAGGLVALWTFIGLGSIVVSAYLWGLLALLAARLLWIPFAALFESISTSDSRHVDGLVTDPYLTDAVPSADEEEEVYRRLKAANPGTRAARAAAAAGECLHGTDAAGLGPSALVRWCTSARRQGRRKARGLSCRKRTGLTQAGLCTPRCIVSA